MNKVRRGDLPAAVAVTGLPANLRGEGKLATPVGKEVLSVSKGVRRRELGPQDGNETKPRRDLTSADTLIEPETDE